jgi:hypothetical protein
MAWVVVAYLGRSETGLSTSHWWVHEPRRDLSIFTAAIVFSLSYLAFGVARRADDIDEKHIREGHP